MVQADSMHMMASELLGVAEAAAASPAAEAPLELVRELLLRGGTKLEASGLCAPLYERVGKLMAGSGLSKRLVRAARPLAATASPLATRVARPPPPLS